MYTLKQKIPSGYSVQKPDYNLMNELQYLALMAAGVRLQVQQVLLGWCDLLQIKYNI